jgi:hypothetical protein
MSLIPPMIASDKEIPDELKDSLSRMYDSLLVLKEELSE